MAPPKLSIMKYVSVVLILSITTIVTAEENPALQKLIAERLGNCHCSVVMMDLKDDHILASLNSDPILKESYPPGSLMKIFTLIAYSQMHRTFPKFSCPPTLARDPQGCWDHNGHGEVDAQKAVAFSCNVYFRQLAERTSPELFERVLKQFAIFSDDDQFNDQQLLRKLMVGTTMEVKVSPERLLHAYSSLFNNAKPSLVSAEVRTLIRNGMAESGRHGTSTQASIQAGVPLLGKTGTSLLIQNDQIDYSRTQGWWIGLYPVDDPEIAIVTFVRNGRGATDAAPHGGKALGAWLEYSGKIADARSRIQDAR
jgi:cell division protein FtsI/penicillin-binding protein 2